jgi:signal transduction histidine kinase
MTLRQRMLLTLAPFICLLAAVGGTGIFLLRYVGDRIDRILQENYKSVVAMVGLNEALERIDSSFQFALAGQEDMRAYEHHWQEYRKHLRIEQDNITEPGEQELVDQLQRLTDEYRDKGDRFFAAAPLGPDRKAGPFVTAISGGAMSELGNPGPDRRPAYFGTPEQPGLLQLFGKIKDVSKAIRVLNQKSMEAASENARRTALLSEIGLAVALLATTTVAGLLAWSTVRAVLRPIEMVTESAVAVGLGDLGRAVPVLSHDEIGRLAEAFNRMTRQLASYRQSHSQRLLRAQRTSQATIDSFPDPVLVVERDGRVEMANPAARALLGIPAASEKEETPAFVWHPPEALAKALQEAVTTQRPFLTQAYDQTITFRCGGQDRAYLPQVLPISDPFGNTLGAAVVLNDVTRFRLLDQMKSDLVATVSHELKTPLTSVRLALHLLLEEAVGPLTPKQTELLLDARDNAERLLNVIEHLLALARLEHGREPLTKQAMAPHDLLGAAADRARTRAEDRHVEMTVEAAPHLPAVAADPDRLGSALDNLVDNALTWTEAGGRITLSAAAGDGRVRLSVSDTGLGIPAEYLPHIFDKFSRIPGRGHGTGLGLAIVREIVTAHGGEVSVESEPGKGTAFHLDLPVAADAGGAP